MNRRHRLLTVMAAAAMTAVLAVSARAQDEFAADAARLVKSLQLRTGQTVADIGAGAGQLSVALAREVGPSGRVYATELNADLLRAIRRTADSAGVTNISISQGHATRTNLPERCCDAVVVRFVYHHFKDPRQMNASLHQALKPGGLLAVIDFAPDSAESADPTGRADGDRHGVTPATVIRELREAGFELVADEPAIRRSGFMVVVRRPAASPSGSAPSTAPPALDAITSDDIRRDLFALAGDEMRGREAGTLDELRASAWVADRARAVGLEPAGDDGTYFQFWPMRRTVTSRSSTVRIGERQVRLGVDAYVIVPINANVSGPVVWLDKGRDTTGLQQSLAGKIVALDLQAPTVLPAPGMSLWAFRYTNAAINESVLALAARRVAAILIVSDSMAEGQITGFFGQVLARGRYGIDSAGVAPAPINVPLVWLSRAYRNDLRAAATPTVSIAVDFDSYLYPSVNVIARVRGTDAALRDQHVLFSAHQDHDGVRAPVRSDSIYNGADDNATVSVALLAIGRAFARQPGRRSALFVWHGAEERGLLGSRWHAWHPVIPRDQIVAVLNADMIGGNHPDTAGLLGVQPPHLNSRDLVRMALEANARVSRFVIDSTWDRPTHPEFWYFRSDHVPYARHAIPSVYFSTLPHRLYHTPADDPASINIDKLTRVTRWMYATGWAAANSERRPDRLEGFRLER